MLDSLFTDRMLKISIGDIGLNNLIIIIIIVIVIETTSLLNIIGKKLIITSNDLNGNSRTKVKSNLNNQL